MKKILTIILSMLLVAMLLTSCGQAPVEEPAQEPEPEPVAEPEPKTKDFTIGSVMPLTGEGAAYGLPMQRVIKKAVTDLNAEWASKGQTLTVEFEDGKCNPKDGLTATQNLVNLKGVKVVLGNGCSGETLGAAPFANENKVIMLSPMSSSPEITNAGDYIFRNYPEDNAQIAALFNHIRRNGYTRVGIVSENTDYAQALREGLKEQFATKNIEVVADEVVKPNAKDVRTELLKVKEANPEALVLLPQTIQMTGTLAKQVVELDINTVKYGNEVAVLEDAVKDHSVYMQGIIGPRAKFAETEKYTAITTETECDLGLYCTAGYDAVFLLGELIEVCGDKDSDCIKEKLYATADWMGPLGGPYTFDENGDVAGNFELLKVEGGELALLE